MHKQSGQKLKTPILMKWIYQHSDRIYYGMDFNDNLYKITGRRVVRIQEVYPTLWIMQNTKEQYHIDANIAKDNAESINAFSEIAKKLNVTPEEARELSIEIDKEDEAEFLSRFSEIAKERGISLEEAYEEIQAESDKQLEELLEQLNEERITRMKKLIQFRKGNHMHACTPEKTFHKP